MVQACSRQEHRQPNGAAMERMICLRAAASVRVRPFGLKVGIVSRTLFATRVRELVGDDAMLEAIMNPLLARREALMRSTPDYIVRF